MLMVLSFCVCCLPPEAIDDLVCLLDVFGIESMRVSAKEDEPQIRQHFFVHAKPSTIYRESAVQKTTRVDVLVTD
jgi:hypothetical protein